MSEAAIKQFFVKKWDGSTVCRLCAQPVEDEQEHLRTKHPEHYTYLEKKSQEVEESWLCGYCGERVRNWPEHMREKHPEIIAGAQYKKKKTAEEEKEEWVFVPPD